MNLIYAIKINKLKSIENESKSLGLFRSIICHLSFVFANDNDVILLFDKEMFASISGLKMFLRKFYNIDDVIFFGLDPDAKLINSSVF